MQTLVNPLVINYLGIKETSTIKLLIEQKFHRLKRACSSIQTCKVKLANVAFPDDSSYLVSITIQLPQGVELYSLRLPNRSQDSFKQAITDVFAQIFRKLIELQIEENHLLHS